MLADYDTTNLDTRYFSDISLQSTQPATAPCDVTTFLASLQEWKVDILPITWQAAQQPIGAGATSRIDEVSQTVHRSFVFKRLSDKHKEPAVKESSLRMILNEIAILSHPRVREHPNVIELEGVCWDVESESQVWPVLVFDKTNWGDLSEFVDKPEWKTLTATLRMNICSDIGRAMSFMHDQRIIHGDIKPENVLIYKDGTDADGYIFMPKSWPWYAPEHHHRGFRPENARNMDMFSFGVLSLWVMYRSYLSGTSLLPAELLWASQYITSRTKDADRWTLDELKKRDELVKFAQRLVSDDAGLEDSAKHGLRVFFGTVLQCNPDIRRSELQSDRSLLIVSNISLETAYAMSWDFQIYTCLDALYRSDYRVRRYIRHALEEYTFPPKQLSEESIDMNGLFQLALCCKIGFGGSADERQTISLLSRCKKSEDDLIEVLNKLKSPEANSKAFPGAIYTTLENVGDISTQDLVSQYRTCGILQDAKDEVKRDLEDLGRSLGTRNAFWTASATLLAGIYSETEQPDEAGVLYFKVMHAIIEMFGEEHELALIATTNVATSLFARGALHDAEEMEVRILEVKRNRLLQRRVHNVLNSQANGTSVYESDDVTIEASSLVQIGTEAQNKLSSLSDRITEALEQRHMDQADALQLETLETLQEVAGADHPTTFSVLHSLIDKYIGRGQWNEVERLQKKEIELSKSKFGHEHSRTLGCLSNLSLTFAQQERWEEARHLQEHTLNTSRTKLGPFHHVTLALMSNLLATFQKLGQDTDAAMIRRQLEDHYRKESSNNLIDSGIADSMANLAVTYRAQGRLQEAEEFQLQVLKERERRLGFEHPNTQRTLAELSLIRENRGKSKKTKD